MLTTNDSTLDLKWRYASTEGTATMIPKVVQYRAIEIPWANCCGLDPDCWEAKISIIPMTVPSRPSRGAIEPIDPSHDRYRDKSCATWPPVLATAAPAMARGAPELRSAHARTRPNGELRSSRLI